MANLMQGSGEIRPYEPNWRDLIAAWLAGDSRQGDVRNNLTRGLLGGTGLGHQQSGIADLTPVGSVLQGNDAVRAAGEGRYGDAAVDAGMAGLGVAPLAGMAIRRTLPAVSVGPGKAPIYDPPILPQRPFANDYPNGAHIDETGRLLFDIDGRPLVAPMDRISGRRTGSGPDRPIADSQLIPIAEEGTGRSVVVEAPGAAGEGVLAHVSVVRETKKPIELAYSSDIPADRLPVVLRHENGHVVDQLAGENPIAGLEDELRGIYGDLNYPLRNGRRASPELRGYKGEDADREFMAEAIRVYMTDPNYMKTVTPKTAAAIRAEVNGNPKLNRIIQFNSVGAAAAGTAAAGGAVLAGGGDANASEAPVGSKTFEIEINGRRFQVEAPDQGAAVEAVRGHLGLGATENVSSRDPAMGSDGVSGDLWTAPETGQMFKVVPPGLGKKSDEMTPADVEQRMRVLQRDRLRPPDDKPLSAYGGMGMTVVGPAPTNDTMAAAAADPHFQSQVLTGARNPQERTMALAALGAQRAADAGPLGTFFSQAVNTASAGLPAMASAMLGRQPFHDELAMRNAADRRSRELNPRAADAGTLAGLAGQVAALPEAAFATPARAMMTNAGLAGTQTYSDTGGNLGAAMGAAAGAGLLGGSMAPDRVRAGTAGDIRSNAPRRAQDFVMREFGDPAKVQAFKQDLQRLGPEAMPADVSPTFRDIARGGATFPEYKDAVIRPLTERNAGRNDRINGMLDTEVGPAPSPVVTQHRLDENAAAVGQMYEPLFHNKVQAVDTTALASDLEAKIANLRGEAQTALQRVRGMLDVHGVHGQLDRNPYTLFQTRQAIDGVLKTEVNPQVIHVLADTRHRVDALLDEAVPGIKAVDAQYAELMQQEKGFAAGQHALNNDAKDALRPQEFQQQFAQAAVPRGAMIGPSAVPQSIRQGARAELDRIVGTNVNDAAALNRFLKGEGDWNRDKLATVFGKDKADRIPSVMTLKISFRIRSPA